MLDSVSETDTPTALTVAEIASVYGQKVATVETLRSRDQNFPAASGRRGRAFVYPADQVRAWAEPRGWRSTDEALGGDHASGLSRLPDVYTATRAALGCLHARGCLESGLGSPDALLSLLLDPASPWAAQVNAAGIGPVLEEGLAADPSTMMASLRQLAHSPEVWGPQTDAAIGGEVTEGGRILPTYSSPRLVRWITALSGQPTGVLVDPACGTGLLLSAVAAKAPGAGVHLLGLDNDAEAIRTSALRLLAHGLNAELVSGDALDPNGPIRSRAESCDLVVADVPSGVNPDWPSLGRELGQGLRRAPKNEQEFLWLATILSMLRPGGRAVVCTPARALESPGRAAPIRSDLVAQGAITAVVTLPSGMRPGAAPSLALWVLRKPVDGTPRPLLTINAAVLEQHVGNETETQQLIAAVLDAADAGELSSGMPLPVDCLPAGITFLPFGGIRLIEPGKSLADCGFNVAPWSPAAQELPPSSTTQTSDSGVDHEPVGRARDIWDELITAREDLDAVMAAYWERHRDPVHSSTSVTLAELLRRGDLLIFDVRLDHEAYDITRSWDFAPEQRDIPTDRTDHEILLAKRPLAGDIAVTRSEVAGATTHGAVVLNRVEEVASLPDGTRRLLRLRDPSLPLTPESIAAAINAVAANGWPQGARGDLDIERATSYIRVPLAQAGELGLEAALHLKERMDPLLRVLADPASWA